MKKQLKLFAILSLVVIAISSCNIIDTTPDYTEEDLMGLWQQDGTEAFVRFTGIKYEEEDYYIGCEWDEGDDKHEEDLVYLGNGYFKWKLVVSTLNEIHLMDNGGAEIPRVYTIVSLTTSSLSYKDDLGKVYHFTRVVNK